MSSKYKVGESQIPHFVTFSVVAWIDMFSREQHKEVFCESLRYCQKHKGLNLHAWVVMTNHVHLIISSKENGISDLVRDIKKFTGKTIVKSIQENNEESRKEWMLNIFKFTGSKNTNNREYQFWKQDYHPIELDTIEKMETRMNYLHQNPVRSGMVWDAWHYKYSSAIDYMTNEKGLLDLAFV
jgi:putative transposase